MRVYCRFAPPCLPVTTGGVENDETNPRASSCVPPPMVLISLRETVVEQKRQQKLTVADPRSGSTVSTTCRHVFLPCYMTSGASETPSGANQPSAAAGQQQQSVFDTTVSPFIEALFSGKRCAFLAYGQTTTGKTYTVFGPGADGDRIAGWKHQQEQIEVDGDLEEDGIVPRLLRAIFNKPSVASQQRELGFLDMSCVEVYNEFATDLVALQLQQGAGRKVSPCWKKTSRTEHVGRNEDASDAAHRAWLRYLRGKRSDDCGASPLGSSSMSLMGVPISRDATSSAAALKRTVYKATEKSTVLRSLQCLRCESAVECWSVLCKLLALRHCSQTERNVRSSRSHLLLRLVLYSAGSDAMRLGEVLVADLAGSETYRDSAWATSNTAEAAATTTTTTTTTRRGKERERGVGRQSLVNRSLQQQLWLATLSPVGSTFALSLRDEDGLTAAQRVAIRTNEMRHINSSLLALRNVVRTLCNTPSATRVPFRDSTLTTILEPFLTPGDETAVVWVVCCSSRQHDFHETVETLRLGAEASAIPASVQLYPIVVPPSNVEIYGNGNGSSSSSSSCLAVEEVRKSGGIEPSGSSSASAPANCGDSRQRGIKSEQERNKAASGAVILRDGWSRATPAEGGSAKEGGGERNMVDGVDAYKQYAHHLLDQCKTLCERYNECVEELARTKQELASRNSEIAQLREALRVPGNHQQLRLVPPLQSSLSSSSSAPTRDSNVTSIPPAWLRQNAVRPTKTDAAPLEFPKPSLPGELHSSSSFVLGAAARAEALGKEGGGEVGSEAEAVRLIESILQQHCIQYVPPHQPDDKLNGSSHPRLDHTTGMPVGVLTSESEDCTPSCISTSGGPAAVETSPCIKGCAFDEAEVHRRRERLVSFVSPSSHGAVPLIQVEEELSCNVAFPPPLPRSSLRTVSAALQSELNPKSGETKAETGDAKILQHLLSRSAAFVGAASKRSET